MRGLILAVFACLFLLCRFPTVCLLGFNGEWKYKWRTEGLKWECVCVCV